MVSNSLEVIQRRQFEQRLAGEPFDAPADAVRALGAVQAQEFPDAKWALAERLRGHTDADLEAAFSRGDILRTHALRPTWHFVAAEDIRWIQSLTGPRVHAFNGYAYRRFEVKPRQALRVADALSGGQALTRKELGAVVQASGVQLAHIVMYAELEALICSGPRRGKQHTYMLVEERAPGARELPREEALAELTRRYFRSHGPATLKDFAWWSSLTMAQVREGLELVRGELAEEVDEHDRSWFAAPEATVGGKARGALLLSVYDESVIAYKDLRVVRDAPTPEGEWLTNPIVIDGRCVGSWKRRIGPKEAVVWAMLLRPLRASQAEALRAAVKRYEKFLGLPVALDIAE